MGFLLHLPRASVKRVSPGLFLRAQSRCSPNMCGRPQDRYPTRPDSCYSCCLCIQQQRRSSSAPKSAASCEMSSYAARSKLIAPCPRRSAVRWLSTSTVRRRAALAQEVPRVSDADLDELRRLMCHDLDLYYEMRAEYRQLVRECGHRGVPEPKKPRALTKPHALRTAAALGERRRASFAPSRQALSNAQAAARSRYWPCRTGGQRKCPTRPTTHLTKRRGCPAHSRRTYGAGSKSSSTSNTRKASAASSDMGLSFEISATDFTGRFASSKTPTAT